MPATTRKWRVPTRHYTLIAPSAVFVQRSSPVTAGLNSRSASPVTSTSPAVELRTGRAAKVVGTRRRCHARTSESIGIKLEALIYFIGFYSAANKSRGYPRASYKPWILVFLSLLNITQVARKHFCTNSSNLFIRTDLLRGTLLNIRWDFV